MPRETGLDRIDHEILGHLQKDARLSNKELAARVGLAPSSCLERVRKLERGGVLRGAHAEVDPAALGIGLQALIQVQLVRHRRAEVERFRTHVLALDETVAVFHLTGEHDFLVQVAVADADHLRDLALDGFTTRQEVARIHTMLVFDVQRRPALPDLAGARES